MGEQPQGAECLQMRTVPSGPKWGLPPGGRTPCFTLSLSGEGVLRSSLWREPRILPKGFKAPLPLEAAFHTRQAKDFNLRFKRTRDQKQMLLEDTSACLAVWGHGYGGEDNSSQNPASPHPIINRCIMGGKERDGCQPLDSFVSLSKSPPSRAPEGRRGGFEAETSCQGNGNISRCKSLGLSEKS